MSTHSHVSPCAAGCSTNPSQERLKEAGTYSYHGAVRTAAKEVEVALEVSQRACMGVRA